jgi:hypothetical protein
VAAVVWSADSPELCATEEKRRIYILRRGLPEDPFASRARLCAFRDLEIEVCDSGALTGVKKSALDHAPGSNKASHSHFVEGRAHVVDRPWTWKSCLRIR